MKKQLSVYIQPITHGFEGILKRLQVERKQRFFPTSLACRNKSTDTMLLPWLNEREMEAGCDEAGRGCLAGPVFAAAVILPPGFDCPQLNDSKQLTEAQRATLRPVIEQGALAWAVARVDPPEIDQINILAASIRAMHLAVGCLRLRPTSLLIDGNRFKPYPGIPHHCIIRGDGKFRSIAAASILAKTWRDAFMEGLSRDYPQYGWHQNKGYPTPAHREAIRQHGPTPLHRKSFRLLPLAGPDLFTPPQQG